MPLRNSVTTFFSPHPPRSSGSVTMIRNKGMGFMGCSKPASSAVAFDCVAIAEHFLCLFCLQEMHLFLHRVHHPWLHHRTGYR